MALARPCLDCGTLTRNGTRCPTHDKANHNAAYGGGWRKISEQQRQEVPYCQCNGCGLHDGPCLATSDLTVDHVTPHSHGGTATDGVRTYCRPCNSSRKDTMIHIPR
jgi:5-methylcytosine-specific restriction enzyme A